MKQKMIGFIIICTLLFTDFLAFPLKKLIAPAITINNVPFSTPLNTRFPFFDFLYEINHKYNGPVGGIVKFLSEHGKNGEKVVTPFGQWPIQYYFPKLKTVGSGSVEDVMKMGVSDAEWLIPRNAVGGGLSKEVNLYIQQVAANWDIYEKFELNSPDYLCENFPEPEAHLFKTAGSNVPRVVIYHKK